MTTTDFLQWRRLDAQRREMRALARDKAAREIVARHRREYDSLVSVFAAELLEELDEPIPYELVTS